MNEKPFAEQLKALPTKPGVYLMKDAAGKVLYVGKASVLRNRVRSYFGSPAGLSPKVRRLVERVADFEYIVTDTELEALVLECNLIKKYRPHYNVRMKDDKQYPYLKINIGEDWAQVMITRRMEKDGARYFGPYADTRSVRRTLELLKKLFPYRSCSKPVTGTDVRPCLDYHIHRCIGPCIGAATKEEYREVLRQVILFLEGKQEQVIRDLRARMEDASEKLEFERAAFLRDQIRSVEKVTERQKIVSATMEDQDVIAFAREDGQACVEVFFVRNGKLLGREHFVLEGTQDEDATQIMTSFVKQFYDSASYIPPRILLQNDVEEMAILERWLLGKKGTKVKIAVPRKGDKKKLVEMVAKNAAEVLQQMRIKWLADADKTNAALEELQEQLGLPTLPRRMECYDISNIQGTSPVGSMIVFEQGQPKSSEYRRFKIKTVEGANDYAMLQEVLRRRFTRGKAARNGKAAVISSSLASAEGPIGLPSTVQEPDSLKQQPVGLAGGEERMNGWAVFPDLIVIDGGKGQVSAAQEALREIGVESVPLIGLAKEHEEIFAPEVSEPIVLPRSSQGLYLVQRLRDEAHRFALSYHQKVRTRRAFTSALDQVPGIGPRRKRALLRYFGSVQEIREATVDDLAAVEGMTRSLAQRLKEQL